MAICNMKLVLSAFEHLYFMFTHTHTHTHTPLAHADLIQSAVAETKNTEPLRLRPRPPTANAQQSNEPYVHVKKRPISVGIPEPEAAVTSKYPSMRGWPLATPVQAEALRDYAPSTKKPH